MSAERYNELVSVFLDGEPGEEELSELEQMLRADPALAEDFKNELVLWEMWSQETAPERSAESFVAAFHTRLRAEKDASDFELSVTEQLKQQKMPFFWPPLVAIAAVVVILLSLTLLMRSPAPEKIAMVESGHIHVQGECVCTHCTLKQTEEHHRAIRYTDNDGKVRIVYLENNPSMDMKMRHFCRGPTPVLVEGSITEEGGHRLLAAKTFNLEEKSGT